MSSFARRFILRIAGFDPCWKSFEENYTHRAVNSPSLQILRIDGEGTIGDVIMHGTARHFWKKKKTRAKKMLLEFDVVGIFVTFNLTGLLPSNHIIAYITMVYRSLWGTARC